MANVLVAGGAGYVGSHVCALLAERGHTPIVYDNLSNGHESFARFGPLVVGDILDADAMDAAFREWKPDAIMHFAGLIEVGHSVQDPLSFYHQNVGGSVALLAATERHGIGRLVFSSTCATYGDPIEVPMSEAHPRRPINPYGRSKAMIEDILRDLDQHRGFRSVALRYFNAAGADPEGRIGERHDPETHAIPLVIDAALGRRARFSIFGTDYDTRDGTCVRDFVHVADLADAHVRALEHLLGGGDSTAINLGTGTGTTVRELIDMVGDVTGRSIPIVDAERREGDAPILVADNAKARTDLGWTPQHDLRSIIETAWSWHSKQNADGTR